MKEATSSGDLETVRALVDAGADVNAKGEDGITALKKAGNNPKILGLLKATGARE